MIDPASERPDAQPVMTPADRPARRRVTLGSIMAAIGLIAADLAILRYLWVVDGEEVFLIALTILPMANLLLLAWSSGRGKRAAPGRAGFRWGGWLAVLVTGVGGVFFPEPFFVPVGLLIRSLPRLPESTMLAIVILPIMIGYTLPQLAVAGLGGWLAPRVRSLLAGRPPASGDRLAASGPRRRFTIGRLMVVVAFCAGDIAVVRSPADDVQLLGFITLPIINALLWTLPRVRSSHRSWRFWRGFQAVGWLAVVVDVVGLVGLPDLFLYPFDPVARRLGTLPMPTQYAIGVPLLLALYPAPQLALAWVVGRLADRYRVVIVRSPSDPLAVD